MGPDDGPPSKSGRDIYLDEAHREVPTQASAMLDVTVVERGSQLAALFGASTLHCCVCFWKEPLAVGTASPKFTPLLRGVTRSEPFEEAERTYMVVTDQRRARRRLN